MGVASKASCWLFTMFLAAMAPAGPLNAAEFPQVTHDGLELRTQTARRVVYARPGATLEPYARIALLECHVAFAKDWQRDHNRETTDLGARVSDADLLRIREDLAAEFRRIFTGELQREDGYPLADTGGSDVLVLRPAIIDLEITAPDTGSAGTAHVITRSAGRMTLHLELLDGRTGTIVARILDAQADHQAFATDVNNVTNRSAADRVLQGWARDLRAALDELH